ncbi:MAG: peptidoglycan DD-metalloendopeptidase family protein [Flaviflexus sp.]|nr:peptidoglycan DD-metalloendopeptidase family protein [Flaviflexus sp.]
MRRAVSAALALILALSASSAAASNEDERDELVRKQQENARELENLQSSLEGVDTNLQEAYLKLEEVRGKIPGAEAELASAQSALAEAVREQEIVSGQLAAAEAELGDIEEALAADTEIAEETQDSLGELARATYRGENASTAMEVWVGSSSTEDFLSSYSMVDSVARSQSSIIAEAQTQLATNRNRQARQSAVREEIEELQAQADALVEQRDARRSEAQAKSDELKSLEASEQAMAADLEGKKSDFEASIATIESEQASTAARIAQINEEIRAEEARRKAAEEEARRQAEAERRAAEEEARRKAAANKPKAPSAPKPAAPKPAAPAPAPSGALLIPPVPAPLYVTSPFGVRWYPITGGYWMHNGVDLRSPCGEAQVAPADGVVSATIPAPGNSTHGNQIFINHGMMGGNSWVTVTNHLSGFAVSKGQRVSKGQVIGYTGQTGNVTGCHVHFEVWRNGVVINPMSLPGFTRRN